MEMSPGSRFILAIISFIYSLSVFETETILLSVLYVFGDILGAYNYFIIVLQIIPGLYYVQFLIL